jgi:hypothetical protein
MATTAVRGTMVRGEVRAPELLRGMYACGHDWIELAGARTPRERARLVRERAASPCPACSAPQESDAIDQAAAWARTAAESPVALPPLVGRVRTVAQATPIRDRIVARCVIRGRRAGTRRPWLRRGLAALLDQTDARWWRDHEATLVRMTADQMLSGVEVGKRKRGRPARMDARIAVEVVR